MRLNLISEGIKNRNNKKFITARLFFLWALIFIFPVVAYADINQNQVVILEQQQRDLKIASCCHCLMPR